MSADPSQLGEREVMEPGTVTKGRMSRHLQAETTQADILKPNATSSTTGSRLSETPQARQMAVQCSHESVTDAA
jgi:hypothetical protein